MMFLYYILIQILLFSSKFEDHNIYTSLKNYIYGYIYNKFTKNLNSDKRSIDTYHNIINIIIYRYVHKSKLFRHFCVKTNYFNSYTLQSSYQVKLKVKSKSCFSIYQKSNNNNYC